MGPFTQLQLRRSNRSRSTFALLAVAGWLLSASLAQAASIPVVFDGPVSGSGADARHFGLSGDGASAAQAAGLPVLTSGLMQADTRLQVVGQSLGSLDLEEEDLITPFEATSRWTLRNISGSAFTDIVYLVFTTVDTRTININGNPMLVDYDESQVGLRVDAAAGWVLFQTSGGSLGTLYYPAVRLGPLGAGAQTQVDVNYYLNQLLSFDNEGDTIVPLPSLRIAMAVVPEPGTGLLFAAGLALLAVRARQRS